MFLSELCLGTNYIFGRLLIGTDQLLPSEGKGCKLQDSPVFSKSDSFLYPSPFCTLWSILSQNMVFGLPSLLTWKEI